MKKLLGILTIAGATMYASAQGTVNFINSGSTLISAGGTAMLSVNNGGNYNFAIFLAPSGTVTTSGQPAGTFDNPLFQTAGAYNVNSTTVNGALVNRSGLDVGTATGNGTGSVVDFIVRGWSANAGATWAAALAYYNNGAPVADMWIGQSTIGNDILLGGGATPATTLFGTGPNQIGGFNMALVPGGVVPEPSSMVLAGLGAASLLLFRRRK